MNRVVLVGRMTKDADLRYTPSGVAVANGTIAVNRPFKNQQGENEADFINFVTWRKQAENLANYTGKGSLIGIDGRIQTRSYEGQDGKRVYITEVLAENIQYLDSRKSSEKSTQQQRINVANENIQKNAQEIDISDDSLPF